MMLATVQVPVRAALLMTSEAEVDSCREQLRVCFLSSLRARLPRRHLQLICPD